MQFEGDLDNLFLLSIIQLLFLDQCMNQQIESSPTTIKIPTTREGAQKAIASEIAGIALESLVTFSKIDFNHLAVTCLQLPNEFASDKRLHGIVKLAQKASWASDNFDYEGFIGKVYDEVAKLSPHSLDHSLVSKKGEVKVPSGLLSRFHSVVKGITG